MTMYFDAFARAFDYSGRSTRSEFWVFQLGWFISSIVVYLAATMLAPSLVEGQFNVVNVGLLLVHAVPALALTTRRLHDSGHSAAWLLWLVLLGIGMIVLACMSLAKPDEGENEYGPDPRDRNRVPSAVRRTTATEPTFGTARTEAAPVEELEKLQALRNSGAIDDAEFAALKSRVLGRLGQ